MKRRLAELVKRLSFFWQLFLLMTAMVAMILVFHTVSNRLYEKQLTESYLEQARLSIIRNCNSVFQDMQMTYAIPVAIEGNRSYDYLRSVTGGSLPEKYRSVLPLISKALRNQLYLQGDSMDTLLYIPGANSICGRNDVYPTAEDCFSKYLMYSETSTEEIMALLHSRNMVTLLPMEQATIWNSSNNVSNVHNIMTLINHPRDSNIVVMSLYEEKQLLTNFGFYDLPEGSGLKIEAIDGEVLYELESREAACHSIKHTDSRFKCVVTVSIPDSYFSEQTSLAKQSGLWMTLIITSLSLLLCLLISRLQSRPLSKLVSDYGDREPVGENKNEFLHLSSILTSRQNEVEALNVQLLRNDLSKVFSGAVLMEKDELRLAEWLGTDTEFYRLAVLNTWDAQQALSPDAQSLSADFLATSVDMTTLGLLFADRNENLEHLQKLMETVGSSISCGVSAKMNSLSNLHIAARQAYLSVPVKSGIGIYTEGTSSLQTMSWMQHERLYQSILMNDETGARELLKKLLQSQKIGTTARETFFCCCFVLYSAAEELGVAFTDMERLNYDSGQSVRENMEQLFGLADAIFRKIEKKRMQYHDIRQEQILAYVEAHCTDYDFCAASVAMQFEMSEKNVYALVRQMRDKTLGEYVLELRMKKAGEMLCKTRDSVELIAEQCGYPVHSTFYRAFKRYYGCTPIQYRSGVDPLKQELPNTAPEHVDNV